MAHGHYGKLKMEHLKTPLSDTEEAVLELLKQVNRLESENQELKEEIKRLRWSIQEQD
jgi:predicted  nucleic acid-binding Zn-ribbon protein